MNLAIDDTSDGSATTRSQARDAFFFTHLPVTLSAAIPGAIGVIPFDTDADFFCTALTYQADIGGATLTQNSNIVPLVRVNILDNGSGKLWVNQVIPIGAPVGALMGDAKEPTRLIRPRWFAGGSSVQFSYFNYVSGGTVINLQPVMHGYKRYYRQG